MTNMIKIPIDEGFSADFRLSWAAVDRLSELKGVDLRSNYGESAQAIYNRKCMFFERTDPHLLQIIGEMGEKVLDDTCELKLVEVDSDKPFKVRSVDGAGEWVEGYDSEGSFIYGIEPLPI